MAFTSKIDWEQEQHNILIMGQNNKTLKEIGEHYGVSRQRVKQVCKKFGIHSSLYGKGALRISRIEQYNKKWGNKNDSELYSEIRHKFRAKKANSIRVGKEWTINFGDLEWPSHCPILGIELNYFSEGRSENSVSFDRIDSSKGYIVGNVQIISWRANRIKNDGTAEEHHLIANYLDHVFL